MSDRTWESMEQLPRNEVLENYVTRDYPSGYLRYTLYPEGRTLVQQPHFVGGSFRKWATTRDAWFEDIPKDTLVVTYGKKYIGTVADICGYEGLDR